MSDQHDERPTSGLRGSLSGSGGSFEPPAPGSGPFGPSSSPSRQGSAPAAGPPSPPPGPTPAVPAFTADMTLPPPGPAAGKRRRQEGRPQRSRTRYAILGAGVVALAGAGWFVTQGLNGASGGADSPEAAVQQLADALGKEDPAAAAGVLAPDEVRTLGDLIGTLEQRAGKAGVTGKDPYAGLDLSIGELDLEVDELSDTVAKVTIDRASASLAVERGDLPDRIEAATSGGDSKESIDEEDLVWERYDADAGREVSTDPFVMAVKRGGGWYVSPTYTLAAYVAEGQGLPDGDFDEEVPDDLKAAESPEQAAVDLVNSLEDLDAESTLGALPSDEWSVLWVYRDAIDEFIDEQTSDGSSFELEVDDQEVETSELQGGFRKVTIKEASGTFATRSSSGEEQAYDWELDGLCLKTDGPDGSQKRCLAEDDDAFDDLVGSTGIEDPFVVVAKDRGGWVVSPTATVLQYAREIVPKLSDAWAYRLLGLEWFAPADGTVEVGKPVEVAFNDAGFAGYDLTIADDERVAIGSFDGDGGIAAYDAQGDEVYELLDASGGLEGGTYRVLVTGEPEGTAELLLSAVAVADLTGRTVAGTLTDVEPVQEFRFTVPASDVFQLDGDEEAYDYSASIVAEDDPYEDLYDYDTGGYRLEAGTTYRLRVSRYGYAAGDDLAFDLELVEGQQLSIDGGSSTSGVVDSGYQTTHPVVVPAGTAAYVYLTSSSGSDLDLACSGSGCDSSASSGGDEEVYIQGPFEGDVIVIGFSGGGSYDLAISEG